MLETGTTTIALTCKEGVVLSADKRASSYFFIASKDIPKIHAIDLRKAMTISGSVGDAQTLVRWIKSQLFVHRTREGKPLSTKGAATLLSNVLFSYKYYPFLVQLILAGYEDETPEIYSIDAIGGITKEKFVSTGSGSPIAYGVLENEYRENLSLEDALKIAAKGIHTSMQRDSATGNGIDLVAITEKGVERYPKEEVEKILKEALKK
ncbi:archaeal proteasome endopeptidase complex subunit beta [Candidatus Micrarchaeota archaeon]|nr:archaeal proteasome endopeptidase complex subunit beta [Candidatus Micrarchaeota archaeon]